MSFVCFLILGSSRGQLRTAFIYLLVVCLEFMIFHKFECKFCCMCSGRRRIPGLRRKALPWSRAEEDALKVCHRLTSTIVCNLGDEISMLSLLPATNVALIYC